MGKGMQYEYRIWRGKDINCHTCYSLPDVKAYTGLQIKDIRASIIENHGYAGWRISRVELKGNPDNKRIVRPKRKNHCLGEFGVVGFSPDGKTHHYADAKHAAKENGMSIHRIYECLSEGNEYMGWTFDYALNEHTEEKDEG